ncbi:MAG: indolepyruvate ferredoxin oxidoreductase subunit alpha [Clostridiales bacterium]|jgi:indolepyruvate ferredoxin oxidoreductase alpha subunit|nr:indolepyruvate ferredoxin oxidoreductase subunit alpha [Clostridiales bacterium]
MKKLLLGNEAIARGAYEAGVTVAAAYPGTPSTEITEYIAAYDEIYAEWSPNEKVALETAFGASLAGARAICAMKHVGLNVAADPLFTASYTGVGGGLAVCVADDPGMHSSQNEQDSRHYAAASKVLMLEPSDSAECRAFTVQAFELSEKFDTPVLLRLTTRVSHSRSLSETGERAAFPNKKYEKNILKNVMMPGMARARHKIVEQRIRDLTEYAETCGLNTVEMNENPPRSRKFASEEAHNNFSPSAGTARKIGVITSGIAYQYAREALGDSVSYLKLGMVYPLPEKKITGFVSSVDICYVIEELDPVIENHCKRLGLNVLGKEAFSDAPGKNPGVQYPSALLGEYTASHIREVVLGEKPEAFSVSEKIPDRPPVMCAGCPHRGAFHVLNQLKLTVTGDIGCYTLGALPPLSAIDASLCMGASIGMAHGMSKADAGLSKKTVAVIGDSTFLHSGITGLMDVVYNRGSSVVMILDNRITGMTGHQDHPGTGRTIKGEPANAVSLEKICEAVGVRRVNVIDPFDIDGLKKLLKQELEADEPSVIITRRPCRLLIKAEQPRFSVSREACKNCGQCMKIGCPAISKQENAAVIDGTLCAGCGLCAGICKFKAIAATEVSV